MRYGDVHNFGKRTHQITRENKNFYVKPRPIFWEWFFAGKNSPLFESFNQNEKLHHLFGGFFGLSTSSEQINENLFSYFNEVVSIETIHFDIISQTLDKFLLYRQFGSFCAYAYVFGLCDMNCENVLISEDGRLQPVDIEISFLEPKFLSDTAIISTGNKFLNFASLSYVIKTFQKPTIDLLLEMLTGFYDGIHELFKNQSVVKSVLLKLMPDINHVPIRNIFRPTRIYHAWRMKYGFETDNDVNFETNKNIIEFYQQSLSELSQTEHLLFPEELIQLKRGDFPYFFSTLKDENIRFVDSPEGAIKKISSKEALKYSSNFPKPKMNIDERFSKERLIDSCLPVGLMEILWDFLHKDFEGKISTQNLEIAINEIAIRIDDHQNRQVYIADRSFDATKNEEIIDARLGIIRKNI